MDATEPPAHVVGDATGDLELVRGGGGGGMRLFCRSGVRSGTGGLPASDEVLLNRRSTGFGARHPGPADVTAVTAAVSATVTEAAAAVSAAADDVDGGVVWSSSSKVSSAFSAPVGSHFPAPLPVPVPVSSTTLPCPTTLPCGTQKRKTYSNAAEGFDKKITGSCTLVKRTTFQKKCDRSFQLTRPVVYVTDRPTDLQRGLRIRRAKNMDNSQGFRNFIKKLNI